MRPRATITIATHLMLRAYSPRRLCNEVSDVATCYHYFINSLDAESVFSTPSV